MLSARPTLAAVTISLLTACAPNLGPRPQLVLPEQKATSQSFATTDGQWPSGQWWQGFGDPQLDRLVDEGLAHSPDLTIALARLTQAQALSEQAGSASVPQISGEASVTAQKQSYNNGIPRAFVPSGVNLAGRAALNLSFDLDLWGRNRALLAAATSEAEAAGVDVAQATLVIATSICGIYADLNRLYAEQDVLDRAVLLQTATRDLVALRVTNGHDTRGQLFQAGSAVSASQVQLSQVKQQIALAKNQLAALLGAGPDRGLQISRPALRPVETGLPSDAGLALIGRRPDIVAARLRAQAAGKRIDAAHADFYPNISLSGLIGLQSLGLSSFLKGGSAIGSFGPALSLPIFRGGALTGRYRQSRGVYDEAVGNYDRTLTAAFREVADALVGKRATAAQILEARSALDQAQDAYRIAGLRYRGGLSTYLDVLIAEQALLAATRTFADVDAQAFSQNVALIRALGGGFTALPVPPAVEPK